MDVSIGDTIPVILEDSDHRRRLPAIKKENRERRRNRKERGKDGRDGVVVHLSGKGKQRRSATPDRHKLTY